MNHREKILQIYHDSVCVDDIQSEIPQPYKRFIVEIAQKCSRQKGVYTVLITLLIHKTLHPNQDIRYHQSNMKGGRGFSGRTIDTQYITPTLRELGLPAMAESGWLTRSLEQPYPYTLDYNGNISDRSVKEAFLNIIDFVQNQPDMAEIVLRLLMNKIREVTKSNAVEIIKISNFKKLDIKTLVNLLNEHFSFNYKTHGGSKLAVIAFYAIYQCLIKEVGRYQSCNLKKLGSHTASDRTSKSAGDIEIFNKNNNLVEAIEIKHGKEIDLQIIRIAKEKILKFNPSRYCIFSSADVKESEADRIHEEIKEIAEVHGCQVIINGILPTLNYYLRLIMSLEDFVVNYSKLVEADDELQSIHKIKWNEILSKFM